MKHVETNKLKGPNFLIFNSHEALKTLPTLVDTGIVE